MVSFNKKALTSLAVFGMVNGLPTGMDTRGLPLAGSPIGGLPVGGLSGLSTGSLSTSANGKTDLKVFADALLKTCTGGKLTSCDAVDSGVVSQLSATVKASAFAALANTHCIASYGNAIACTEATTYLAATYWAYISGWTGAELYSVLGAARLDRFNALIGGFCGSSRCPTNTCGDIWNQWTIFDDACAAIKTDVNLALTTKIKSTGFLKTLDGCTKLQVNADGKVHISTRALDDVFAKVSGTASGAGALGLKGGDSLNLLATGSGKLATDGTLHITRDLAERYTKVELEYFAKIAAAAAAASDINVNGNKISADASAVANIKSDGKVRVEARNLDERFTKVELEDFAKLAAAADAASDINLNGNKVHVDGQVAGKVQSDGKVKVEARNLDERFTKVELEYFAKLAAAADAASDINVNGNKVLVDGQIAGKAQSDGKVKVEARELIGDILASIKAVAGVEGKIDEKLKVFGSDSLDLNSKLKAVTGVAGAGKVGI